MLIKLKMAWVMPKHVFKKLFSGFQISYFQKHFSQIKSIFVALDNSNNSKPSQLVTVHGEATLTCPVLQEVVEKDGAFDIAYWSICTSKSCQDQDATWAWIAGMNGTGAIKVGREGINMTIDGTLDIHRVRLMCTVKRINHRSPIVHFATLIVNNKDGEFKLCCLFPLKKSTSSLSAAYYY